AKEKNIKIINSAETPEIAASVSELVFGGLISLIRNIPYADSSTKAAKWEKKACKGVLLDGLLYGKTIGIIGFGRIGHAVAKKALAFDMKVLTYDPHPPKENPKHVQLVELNNLLNRSDIITLHIPSIKGPGGTENFFNAEKIKKCKDGAVVVNTSRAAIWDEQAVVEALKKGKLGGAVVDVFIQEKVDSPSEHVYDQVKEKTILTPHLGSQTVGCQKASAKHLVEKIKEMAL
ncbi:MAG: NAD(P)-dependent oxidoreductase, partial [Candidatus Altiarchaeota archaeon]